MRVTNSSSHQPLQPCTRRCQVMLWCHQWHGVINSAISVGNCCLHIVFAFAMRCTWTRTQLEVINCWCWGETPWTGGSLGALLNGIHHLQPLEPSWKQDQQLGAGIDLRVHQRGIRNSVCSISCVERKMWTAETWHIPDNLGSIVYLRSRKSLMYQCTHRGGRNWSHWNPRQNLHWPLQHQVSSSCPTHPWLAQAFFR